MDRGTLKATTVMVMVGRKRRVLSVLGSMPPHVRQRLSGLRPGFRTATILIADERGRAEVLGPEEKDYAELGGKRLSAGRAAGLLAALAVLGAVIAMVVR